MRVVVTTPLQLGVSERPYMVVEACSALRPTQSLRGTSEQYQVRACVCVCLCVSVRALAASRAPTRLFFVAFDHAASTVCVNPNPTLTLNPPSLSNLTLTLLPQIVQREVVAAAAALLPRVHVVINREPRKGAMEASVALWVRDVCLQQLTLGCRSTSLCPLPPASSASTSTARYARDRSQLPP